MENKPEEKEFENRVDLSDLQTAVEKIRHALSDIVVGQQKTIDLIIVAILADGHVLLEGVPGIAKTLMAKLVARSLDADFARLQFTPDLMPSDVLGTSAFNLKSSEFEFKPGPVFSNIILIDEINRAPAKTQASLFEVMEERQVSIDGQTYPMEEPYLVLATQNPIEQEGTYRLPEAQLDRFFFKISMDYPSLEEEQLILERHASFAGADPLTAVKPVLSPAEILAFRGQVNQLVIEKPVLHYIAKIVEATRHEGSFYLGASPRASLALLRGSRALAAIQGRDFVTPEDVKFLCAPVLSHRVILSAEREMEGITVEEVIEQLVNRVEVPR